MKTAYILFDFSSFTPWGRGKKEEKYGSGPICQSRINHPVLDNSHTYNCNSHLLLCNNHRYFWSSRLN
jgi:hypothetical protein